MIIKIKTFSGETLYLPEEDYLDEVMYSNAARRALTKPGKIAYVINSTNKGGEFKGGARTYFGSYLNGGWGRSDQKKSLDKLNKLIKKGGDTKRHDHYWNEKLTTNDISWHRKHNRWTDLPEGLEGAGKNYEKIQKLRERNAERASNPLAKYFD